MTVLGKASQVSNSTKSFCYVSEIWRITGTTHGCYFANQNMLSQPVYLIKNEDVENIIYHSNKKL